MTLVTGGDAVVTDKGADTMECRILLSEWLPIWECLGLRYIPAEPIGSATVAEWIDTIDGKSSRAVEAAMSEAARTEPGYMVRWDCCAGWAIKRQMSDLGEAEDRWPDTIDDPRLCDILFDCAGIYGVERKISLYRRPWVQALMVDGWPLEFRCYYSDRDLQGVSSYYPQRPLPERYEAHAQVLVDLTDPLVGAGARDFSADWLYPDDGGKPLLIECGPPHERGAHPCCFKPGEIRGIALVDRNEHRGFEL